MKTNLSLPGALRHQAISCATLGSKFTARLLNLLADHLRPGASLTDRLFNWPGDISSSGASVPLRLAGALHRLVLSGQHTALVDAYPPNNVDDGELWAAIAHALQNHTAQIERWLNSPPQTNEVRRAATIIATAQLFGRSV